MSLGKGAKDFFGDSKTQVYQSLDIVLADKDPGFRSLKKHFTHMISEIRKERLASNKFVTVMINNSFFTLSSEKFNSLPEKMKEEIVKKTNNNNQEALDINSEREVERSEKSIKIQNGSK